MNESRATHSFEGTVTRVLALGYRIMQAREYTAADALREFGMPLRSYRRNLARLRAAGMVLESPNVGRPNGPAGLVRFVAFDALFSEHAA